MEQHNVSLQANVDNIIVNDCASSAPADYSDGARAFTFTPDNFESSYCFPIPIENDMVVEYTESFSLMLTTFDADVVFKIAEHTVEIIDNDCEFASQS